MVLWLHKLTLCSGPCSVSLAAIGEEGAKREPAQCARSFSQPNKDGVCATCQLMARSEGRLAPDKLAALNPHRPRLQTILLVAAAEAAEQLPHLADVL